MLVTTLGSGSMDEMHQLLIKSGQVLAWIQKGLPVRFLVSNGAACIIVCELFHDKGEK